MPKGKLTLSIDQAVIEQITTQSQRERVSISSLVEEFLRTYVRRKKPKKVLYADKYAGSLTNRVKESDVFRDDRVGHILRKSGWGQEVMKKHAKK